MPVMHRDAQRTETVLRQVLDAIEELSLQYAQEEEDGDRLHPEQERDLLLSLAEDAAERGLPEERVEKILRFVLHVAKEAREQ